MIIEFNHKIKIKLLEL